MDGLGELAGALGAAAELAEDAPGLQLGVRARRVSAVSRGRGWRLSGILLALACQHQRVAQHNGGEGPKIAP